MVGHETLPGSQSMTFVLEVLHRARTYVHTYIRRHIYVRMYVCSYVHIPMYIYSILTGGALFISLHV